MGGGEEEGGGLLGGGWKCTPQNLFVDIHLNFQMVLYVPTAPFASLFPRGWGMGAEKVTDPHRDFAKDTEVTTDRPHVSGRATIQAFLLLLPPRHFHSFFSQSCLFLFQRQEPARCPFPTFSARCLSSAGCCMSCFSPSLQPSVSFGHPTSTLASPPKNFTSLC